MTEQTLDLRIRQLMSRVDELAPQAPPWETVVADREDRMSALSEALRQPTGEAPTDEWPLATPVDAAIDSDEASANEQRGDRSSVDVLWEDVERPAPSERGRWSGVAMAVAAAILVVVGVVVVADGNSGEVLTDPASTPSVDDPVASPGVDESVPSSERSGVTEDHPVFGGPGEQRMFGVTVDGTGLVAVGQSDSDAAVWTSVDGIIWSRVPHDEAIFGGAGWGGLMFDVTVGGPGLVAVGGEGGFGDSDSDAVVWTSVDGLIWSRVPHDEAVFGGGWITSVIVAGPGLVAVGSADSSNDPDAWTGADAAVWTSVDGLIWSRVPHDEAVFGGADTQWMSSVTVGGPGLVAVGTDGVGVWDNNGGLVAAVWTSVDGITWSRVPHDEAVFGRVDYESDLGTTQSMISVTAGGPGLVAVGTGGRGGAPVWTSVDGVTWSRAPDNGEVFDGWFMSRVTDAGPGLVAVGGSMSGTGRGAPVWTSVDGITWSRVPNSETGIDTRSSVIAASSGLVAVGGDGRNAAVWTSVDGITWSRVTHDQATGDAG